MPLLAEATARSINRRTCLSGFGLGSVALAQLLAEGTTAVPHPSRLGERVRKGRHVGLGMEDAAIHELRACRVIE